MLMDFKFTFKSACCWASTDDKFRFIFQYVPFVLSTDSRFENDNATCK